MAKAKKQFSPHIYPEWGELFDSISAEERSELLLAITKFPEYEPKNVPIWNFIKSQLQKDYEIFIEKCESNSNIIKNYWAKKNNKTTPKDTNSNGSIRTNTNENECIPKRITNNVLRITKTDNLNKKEKEKEKEKFTPPTLEDVSNYCTVKGFKFDVSSFLDYYQSNGWRVGKNPMKDWRAAVRNWNRNEVKYARGDTATPYIDYNPMR